MTNTDKKTGHTFKVPREKFTDIKRYIYRYEREVYFIIFEILKVISLKALILSSVLKSLKDADVK